MSDPLAVEGHRLAVAAIVAGIRQDDVAVGVLLEEFEPSVLTHALMHAVAIAGDLVRHIAAERGIPEDTAVKVFRDGLLRLG
jgi:hypothetical protein